MVIQSAIDNLKDKPKDDKKAVAGGIAISVVVILLIGWSFYFIKKIQSGSQLQNLRGAGEEFLGEDVRAAQDALMEDFTDIDELRRVREGQGGQYQQGVSQPSYEDSYDDQFGGSGSL